MVLGTGQLDWETKVSWPQGGPFFPFDCVGVLTRTTGTVLTAPLSGHVHGHFKTLVFFYFRCGSPLVPIPRAQMLYILHAYKFILRDTPVVTAFLF